MFIAANAYTKIFAPLGARPGSGTNGQAGKSGCVPELRSKEGSSGYRHLALWGEAANNDLLHFQVESAFANDKKREMESLTALPDWSFAPCDDLI